MSSKHTEMMLNNVIDRLRKSGSIYDRANYRELEQVAKDKGVSLTELVSAVANNSEALQQVYQATEGTAYQEDMQTAVEAHNMNFDTAEEEIKEDGISQDEIEAVAKQSYQDYVNPTNKLKADNAGETSTPSNQPSSITESFTI